MERRRTDEELRQASDHLAYEFEMFEECIGWLSVNWGKCQYPVYMRYAFLEAFCIHTRNLIAFFDHQATHRRGRQGNDDVSARHFFKNPHDWDAFWLKVQEPDWLDEVRIAVNKRVAHLTYARIGSDYTWEWAAICDHFECVMMCFLEHAPDEVLHPDLIGWRESRRNR